MIKMKWFFVLMMVFILVGTVGCGGAKQEYTLECNIDTEQYGFTINGEEGPLTTQTHGESRSTEFKDGKMSSTIIEINRTMTFQDTGHSYDIEGEISVNFLTGVVAYDITAAGETFDEPQTCQK